LQRFSVESQSVHFNQCLNIEMTKIPFSLVNLVFSLALLPSSAVYAQERSQLQFWQEIAAADQTFAARSSEIGRARAFLEILGEDSVVFREGPVDALALYSSEAFQESAAEINWKAHYIDVSRAGDLGLSAGPVTIIDPSGDSDQDSFGHLISVWKKTNNRWELMSDIFVFIPGFLSLEVEPNIEDTVPVYEETAHPVLAMDQNNTLQSLIDADNLFGRSINFRGGQRALLRFGLENSRVYLPGMAPAVGAESASSVYGAFLDNQLSTTNPISLTYLGGFLSESKEMGYTYGTMEADTDDDEEGFITDYLRLWRFTNSNEWRIAVEVLSPH
jgi:hypothetical protein